MRSAFTPFSVALCAATALLAQVGEYAGPALLSRGAGGGLAPNAPIAIRPYINLSAIFMEIPRADAAPGPAAATGAAAGGEAALGVYGYHSWKRTELGLNYRGDYRKYSRNYSGSNGTNQMLTFGVNHRPSRHVTVSLRQAAGTFKQNYGYMGTFGFFDPTFGQIPRDELLDSRTEYFTTMADVSYAKSARLSFNFGGTAFQVRRRASSLYDVTGTSARADAAYRLTRRTSLAVDYFFSHFTYNRAFGSSDLHSVGFNYAVQFSRRWSLALRLSAIRVETLSLGLVQIDPAVAALIGRNAGMRAFYRANTKPGYWVQLSRTFRHGSLYINGNRGAAPGNGVYLTSQQNTFDTMYSFTGLRHWSLGVSAYYSDMRSVGQDIARYRSYSGASSVARSLGRDNLFLTARLDARRYLTENVFQRTYYTATIGIAYSPGDVPLRLW